MFGTNEVEGKRHNDHGTLLDVVDIFETIQGEGPYAGVPATFVRLAGCHLRCFFCDTDFTTHRIEQPRDYVMGRIRAFPHKLVVLTGGEPLRQNIQPLASQLAYFDHIVQVETAGHFWWPGLESAAEFVVSPKTTVVHPEIHRRAIAWKYIMPAPRYGDVSGRDGLPSSSTQVYDKVARQIHLARPPVEFPPERIYIQPCDYGEPSAKAEALARAQEVCMKYGYRLSLQQHKILNLP